MKVAEIFPSIHGECNGHHQGRRVTFVRFSGCNLKCYYCDTPETQSFGYGEEMSRNGIIARVIKIGLPHVCLTGGEPLIAPGIELLLHDLWDRGFKISVETNGTVDISPYFRYVESFVVDFKTISTGYYDKMVDQNYQKLRKSDVVKFVVANTDDIEDAKACMDEYIVQGSKATFAFSPVHGKMDPKTLYDYLEAYGIDNAVLSLQIHKLIGLS